MQDKVDERALQFQTFEPNTDAVGCINVYSFYWQPHTRTVMGRVADKKAEGAAKGIDKVESMKMKHSESTGTILIHMTD